MMGLLGKSSAVVVVAGIIILQVIVPATIDLILSVALAGAAGWAGYSAAKVTK